MKNILESPTLIYRQLLLDVLTNELVKFNLLSSSAETEILEKRRAGRTTMVRATPDTPSIVSSVVTSYGYVETLINNTSRVRFSITSTSQTANKQLYHL